MTDPWTFIHSSHWFSLASRSRNSEKAPTSWNTTTSGRNEITSFWGWWWEYLRRLWWYLRRRWCYFRRRWWYLRRRWWYLRRRWWYLMVFKEKVMIIQDKMSYSLVCFKRRRMKKIYPTYFYKAHFKPPSPQWGELVQQTWGGWVFHLHAHTRRKAHWSS